MMVVAMAMIADVLLTFVNSRTAATALFSHQTGEEQVGLPTMALRTAMTATLSRTTVVTIVPLPPIAGTASLPAQMMTDSVKTVMMGQMGMTRTGASTTVSLPTVVTA